jgi:phosphoribosylanthranilate isomerase
LGSPVAPKVKICCIGSVEEAWLAIRHGASALGLVSEMPSGPGVIPEDSIAEIASTVPPFVTSVLLTSERDAPSILEQHGRCGTNAIQICDEIGTRALDELRRRLSGVKIIQVIHVRGEESVEEAASVTPHVDAVLLDSGDPSLRVKELGGTGRIHDWEISRRIRESVGVPVILAGGLDPENVGEAIRSVRPYAVDVCSGVRTGGRLDESKLGEFFQRVTSSL